MVRNLATGILAFLTALTLVWFLARQIGFAPFAIPPRVGERAVAVVVRLGPPHFDSRLDGDGEGEFRLGYTDGTGTRYHLTVKQGVIVSIDYSSR